MLTPSQGAPAGFEQILTKCSWSKTDNGARVAAGGGDRTVTIWDVESGKILYKLGGHKGSVGAVDFHPREPISESSGRVASTVADPLSQS